MSSKRRWKAIKRADSKWPLGTEGRVFWRDIDEPSVLAIYYIDSGTLGVVDCVPGGYKELNEHINIEDIPSHPEIVYPLKPKRRG